MSCGNKIRSSWNWVDFSGWHRPAKVSQPDRSGQALGRQIGDHDCWCFRSASSFSLGLIPRSLLRLYYKKDKVQHPEMPRSLLRGLFTGIRRYAPFVGVFEIDATQFASGTPNAANPFSSTRSPLAEGARTSLSLVTQVRKEIFRNRTCIVTQFVTGEAEKAQVVAPDGGDFGRN